MSPETESRSPEAAPNGSPSPEGRASRSEASNRGGVIPAGQSPPRFGSAESALASGEGKEPRALDRLFSAALAVRQNAYAPYSGYRVGAALLDEAGRVFGGCNVENAAYPVGTCAEAGAIAAMAAGGGRRIAAVLVIAGGPELVAPCGACRQRIREFAADDIPVHLADEGGVRRTMTVAELLPFAFGPDRLAGPGR